MALFDIENPETGEVITVDHPQAPTQEEAAQVLVQLPSSPVATPGIKPPTTEEIFAQRYTRQQQRPALEKAVGLVGTGAQALAGLVKTAVEGVEGYGDIAGRRVGQFQGAEGLDKLLNIPGVRMTGDIGQSAIEAAGRVGFDLTNLIRQAGAFAADRPMAAAELSIPVIGPLLAARSRTPGQEEISEAFQRELANKAEQQVRGSGPMVPEIIGETNIPLAEALPFVIGGGSIAPKTIAAAKTIPLVEGASRIGGAVGRAITGGASFAARNILPQPLVKNIVTALDPRANALNPAKTVKAMKDAEFSVKRILPELTPEDLAHPQTLADNATLKLQGIHAKREALAGTPIQISLDPLADAYVKLASEPALKMAKPQVIPQLEARALELRGKTLSGSDAERFNQYLNAENSALYVKTGVERSKALKVDPMLAAGEDAAQALRKQLDAGFGAEFGELGKDYGAWRNVTELAQTQAVKQAKIEGRLGLYEGLSALQAISASGEPLRAALSLAGGQVLKYVGSPLARFESAGVRLAEEIKKGKIPQPRTVAPAPAPTAPIAPPAVTAAPAVVPAAPAGIAPATLQSLITQSLAKTGGSPVAAIPPTQLRGVITRGDDPVVAPVATDLESAIQTTINRPKKSTPSKAATQAPTFQKELFQGRGASLEDIYGAEAVAEGRASPLFGKAQYYATTENDAAIFGKVTKHNVSLKNPIILDSDQKWFKLLKDADTPHLNNMDRLFYTESQKIPAASEKLQSYLKSKGFDGIVVNLSETSDQTRRLGAMAGNSQVVKFD